MARFSLRLTTTLFCSFALVRVAATNPPDRRSDHLQREKTTAVSSGNASAARGRVVASYAQLPLRFEVNQGQTDYRVRFLSRGSGYSLFLTSTEAVLALRAADDTGDRTDRAAQAGRVGPLNRAKHASRSAVLRMELVGANAAPVATAIDPLPTKSNYFIGTDPKAWRTGVP